MRKPTKRDVARAEQWLCVQNDGGGPAVWLVNESDPRSRVRLSEICETRERAVEVRGSIVSMFAEFAAAARREGQGR